MEQNQSSAPWLRPPNTLCNTDGWRRTRKSTSKITVRSAKKQERLKKHGTQNQSATGFDLETPLLPSLPTQDVTTGTGLSATSQGSPTSSPTSPNSPRWRPVAPQTSRWPTDLSGPGEVSVKAGSKERRGVCEGLHAESVFSLRFSKGREHRQDVLVIIMAPVEMSVVQSFCCFTPSLREILSSLKCCSLEIQMECFKFLKKWDETGGRGRLRRSSSKNPSLS